MNKNFLIIFVFILFTNNSLACDALKLTGTKVSSAKKTFFIIDYRVNERVEKQIQFAYLEHYLQFTDLLKQLDYKEVLTKQLN